MKVNLGVRRLANIPQIGSYVSFSGSLFKVLDVMLVPNSEYRKHYPEHYQIFGYQPTFNENDSSEEL